MYEGILLHYIYIFVLKLVEAFKASMVYVVASAAGRRLRTCFSASAVWGFIISEEKTSTRMKYSFFFQCVQKIIDVVLLMTGKLHTLISPLSYRSISGFAVGRALKAFIFTICLFIFIPAVTPHARWNNQYFLLMAAAIALLYLLKAASDREYRLDIRKLDFALWIFILSAFLAAATSISTFSSMKTFILNAVPFLLILIMVNAVKAKEEISFLLYSIIAAVSTASLIGLWQYINHVPVDPLLVDVVMGKGVGRIFSTMGNPNIYAEFLILSLPFYGAVFFNTRGIKGKAATAALAVLPLSNLVLTYSRASFIAVLVVIAVFVFLKNWRWVPVLIVLAIIAVPFLPASIIDRMRHLGKDTSSLYRVEIWKVALRILKDYWFTGIGLGAEPFMRLFPNYSLVAAPAHSHMFPLQLWLESGIVGFLSFIWFVIRLVKKGVLYVSKKRDKYLGNIIIAGIASLAGIFIIGFVEHIWFYPRVMNVFWIYTGIMLTALNLAGVTEVMQHGKK